MLNNKSLVSLSLAALVAATCAGNIWNIDIDPHIVNGKPAARSQFPYYALVNTFWSNDENSTCGGTLINNQWILTAGLCVSRNIITAHRFEIHLGALTLYNFTEEGRVKVSTKQSFPHPKYSADGFQNDVALLKLEEPVQFSDHIQALNITQKLQEPGTNVTAIGFGATSSSGMLSSTLQYAEIFLIAPKICAESFPILFGRKDIICTLGNNKTSPCYGDTGGPLVAFENGVPALVGGSSFVSSAGCGYAPTGYFNTFIFTSWIQETIANN